MAKDESKINPDELFNVMQKSMNNSGFLPLDRKRFDEIFHFNELCQKLIDKNDGDYEFPFVYLVGKMFNRMTPECRKKLLRDFEQEMSEWS